jgi:hypothetical protein
MRELDLSITETTVRGYRVVVPDDFDATNYEALELLADEIESGEVDSYCIDEYECTRDHIEVDNDEPVKAVNA